MVRCGATLRWLHPEDAGTVSTGRPLKNGRYFVGLPPGNHLVRYKVDGAWIGGLRLAGGEYEIKGLTIRLDN